MKPTPHIDLRQYIIVNTPMLLILHERVISHIGGDPDRRLSQPLPRRPHDHQEFMLEASGRSYSDRGHASGHDWLCT
jgi:hypothetical protein